MPDPTKGNASAFDPGLVNRVSGFTIPNGPRTSGPARWAAAWFGPSTPPIPVAPETQGRRFDYPVAYNIAIRPRTFEGLDFTMLRGLADASDMVRMAVETRKDQIAKVPWRIRKKGQAPSDTDAISTKIEAFLQSPDGDNDYLDWFRMLMEDVLVIDAPSVYIRRTKGGQPLSLDVIDGSTIKRVLDERGRTPDLPDVAYQQVIKGLPTSNFTRSELVYKPRNPRPHRVYGYSPVEQVVVSVNIALRRQVSQLQAYTEGNIPDSMAAVPSTWAPQQIAEFQAYWDTVISGDTAARRRMKFIPGDMKIERMNMAPLFDKADEWLARVICYAFSLPPSAFVNQMNRATATNAQEVSLEEGLAPLMTWTERFMTRLIRTAFPEAGGYEFAFTDMQDIDPMVQAQVDALYITNNVRSPADVAAEHGWSAPPPPTAPMAAGPTVIPFGPPPSGDDANTKLVISDGERPKLAKAVAEAIRAGRIARAQMY